MSCVARGRVAYSFSETQVGSFYSPHLCSPGKVPPPSRVGCLSQMPPVFVPQAQFQSGHWHGRLVPRTHGEGGLLSLWVTSVLSYILVSEAGHAPRPSSLLKAQPLQTPESLPSGCSLPLSLRVCLAAAGLCTGHRGASRPRAPPSALAHSAHRLLFPSLTCEYSRALQSSPLLPT